MLSKAAVQLRDFIHAAVCFLCLQVSCAGLHYSFTLGLNWLPCLQTDIAHAALVAYEHQFPDESLRPELTNRLSQKALGAKFKMIWEDLNGYPAEDGGAGLDLTGCTAEVDPDLASVLRLVCSSARGVEWGPFYTIEL